MATWVAMETGALSSRRRTLPTRVVAGRGQGRVCGWDIGCGLRLVDGRGWDIGCGLRVVAGRGRGNGCGSVQFPVSCNKCCDSGQLLVGVDRLQVGKEGWGVGGEEGEVVRGSGRWGRSQGRVGGVGGGEGGVVRGSGRWGRSQGRVGGWEEGWGWRDGEWEVGKEPRKGGGVGGGEGGVGIEG